MTLPTRLPLLLAILALLTVSPASAQTRIGPQSGLPVPRFASLKFDVVNGREGPSFDHPVVWEYHRRGLPVLVIEEDLDWWKVRDPDGDEVWIHRRGLETRRMGLVSGEAVPIRRQPEADAPVTAVAEPGVLLEIKDCRGGWLRVDGARAVGWLPADALWGPGCG
jgi:SH3-like domain-containing protein